MIEPFPLTWIPGKARTPSTQRRRAKFQVNFAKARDDLLVELKRLNAINIKISSNVPVRRDGLPYANFRNPEDPGVAVYFTTFQKDYALGCDCWDRVKDNLRAIGKHIEALRGIERWGVSSVEEVFLPFLLPTASPTYQQQNGQYEGELWWVVLNVSPGASLEEIKTAYRTLSRTAHPDKGGEREAWERLLKAYQQALEKAK